MKKEVSVEVHYVKRRTMVIAAVACLAVGFMAGILYKTQISGSGGQVREYLEEQPIPRAQSDQRSAMMQALQQRVTAEPGNFDAWLQLGNLYFDSDQYNLAITAYGKYLEIKPDNADVWTDLGIMYRRSGQPDEAIKAFDRAIRIDPKHEPSRFNKGIVLLHDLNNQKAAIEVWEALLEANPGATASNGRSVRDMIESLKKNTD